MTVTTELTEPVTHMKSRSGPWGVLAGVIYFVGLLAPLTPSHGHPTLLTLVLFAGMPLGVVILAAAAGRSRLLRALLVAEALAILLFTGCVLHMQGAI